MGETNPSPEEETKPFSPEELARGAGTFVPAETEADLDRDPDDMETKRILRPNHPSFSDTGKMRHYIMKTLLPGTAMADSEVQKIGKAHEVRYDFCVDPTLDHLRSMDRYKGILLPGVLEKVKEISMSILPAVIGQILEKYKKQGLKEGDLQIDEQGRITIPDKKVVKVRKRRVPFSSRTKKGKARSVLRLDEEIRSRYLSVARTPLRNLAKEIARERDIPDDLIEKFAGRYLILGTVRENRHCHMYMARDVNTNELVALKVFYFSNDDVRSRYYQEVMTLEMLRGNERVPEFKEADETEESGYMAMEWIDGIDFQTYLQQQDGFLPLSANVDEDGAMRQLGVMELGLQLATILHQCHDDSPAIIHRDISEMNVMLNTDMEVILTDFGISARRDVEGKLAARDGMTPAYASPEALLGEPFDETTDVYSFGVLLYKAITGRLPHEGSGTTSTESTSRIMVQRMRNVTPPDIRELRPETPSALAGMVMQCLSHASEQRPDWATILQNLLALYEVHFERGRDEEVFAFEEVLYASSELVGAA